MIRTEDEVFIIHKAQLMTLNIFGKTRKAASFILGEC